MSTSIQRWVYESAETVPDALRRLADTLEREHVPKTEYRDDSDVQVVTIQADDEGYYVAGACLSYEPSRP